MNVNLGIWPKLTKVVIFLLFLAGALGVCVWYLPTIRQNEQMRKEVLRLDRDLKRAVDEARSLESSLKALRTDPKSVERLARESLGYAKPGETVIHFEEPVPRSARSRAVPAK
jgi:cell division protein FtsB